MLFEPDRTAANPHRRLKGSETPQGWADWKGLWSSISCHYTGSLALPEVVCPLHEKTTSFPRSPIHRSVLSPVKSGVSAGDAEAKAQPP